MISVSRKAVEKTFEALFALTDIRQLWRDTAPSHKLSDEQKKKLKESMDRVKAAIKEIEDELR